MARRRGALLGLVVLGVAIVAGAIVLAPRAWRAARIRAFLARLDHPDPIERREALGADQTPLLVEPEPFLRLIDMLDDPDQRVRLAAGNRLYEIVVEKHGGGPPAQFRAADTAKAVGDARTALPVTDTSTRALLKETLADLERARARSR